MKNFQILVRDTEEKSEDQLIKNLLILIENGGRKSKNGWCTQLSSLEWYAKKKRKREYDDRKNLLTKWVTKEENH